MYRQCSCLLIILLLNGCAIIDRASAFRVSPEEPGQAPSYQSEKQVLFDQPYVDPLTDYLIEHQGDPDRELVSQQIRQERDRRCQTVAAQYADEPATEQVLRRYNFNYGYSCPQQVAVFEKRVMQQVAKPEPQSKAEPQPEPEPVTEAVPEDVDSASNAQVSNQALSNCYLLTTIRNFSAAREACQKPAEKGDARSQANMALVSYAFEDYETAFDWAEKAAAASGEAAFLLGEMYDDGRGVRQNTDKALYWYKEAVRQGHKEAQTAISDLKPEDTR
jgi:hypothetical protein